MRRSLLALIGVLPALVACHRGQDLASPDPDRRAAAVREAGRRGQDGTAALVVAQRDPDPRVRRAAAEAFAAREGTPAVDALAAALTDPDPEVVAAAARGLAARPSVPRTREALVAGYAWASPAGRADIADALQSLGTSLGEAVELEARTLWERNLAALADPGPARAGAAEELGASGRAEAVTRLVPLLDPNRNPDRAVMAAAARGLGEAGDRAARRQLEELLEEADAAVSEAAAEGLGRLGDPASADALATAAVAGSGRTAGAAVEALAALPQAPEVGASLCEVALRSVDPAVAARAARATREREAECPLKPLLARLGRPGTVAALAALAELRPADSEVVPRLVPLLDPAKSPEPEVRRAALAALGGFRGPAAGAAVRERVQALEARVTAARARWIAGRLPAAALPGLEAGGEARLRAVLGRPSGPAATAETGEPDVAAWLPAPAADLAELSEALAAAGRLRAPGAEASLRRLAADPDPGVRAGALRGLGSLAGEAALAVEAAGLADREAQVRRAAAAALQRAGPKGVKALVEALAQPSLDPELCPALARALGEAALPEAVPALAGRLGGPCGPAAAQALGKIASPAAAAPLVEALGRADAPGRLEMVEALGLVGGDAGAVALARELTSDRPQIRAAAARALAALRYEPSSNRLEALRSDYYGRVRRAAVEALSKLPTGTARTRP